jgi:hypothetical protein
MVRALFLSGEMKPTDVCRDPVVGQRILDDTKKYHGCVPFFTIILIRTLFSSSSFSNIVFKVDKLRSGTRYITGDQCLRIADEVQDRLRQVDYPFLLIHGTTDWVRK